MYCLNLYQVHASTVFTEPLPQPTLNLLNMYHSQQPSQHLPLHSRLPWLLPLALFRLSPHLPLNFQLSRLLPQSLLGLSPASSPLLQFHSAPLQSLHLQPYRQPFLLYHFLSHLWLSSAHRLRLPLRCLLWQLLLLCF